MSNLGAALDSNIIVRFIIAVNDGIITICYFIIPIAMYYIYKRSTLKLVFDKNYEREKYILKNILGAYYSFIFTCGLTHGINFIRFFWLEYYFRMVLMTICSISSAYAVIVILIYGSDILNMLSKIEITDAGTTDELKIAFNIAIGWSVDMVSINDSSNLKFIHVNQSCNAFGYSENSISGLTLFNIIHPEDIRIIETMQNRNYYTKEEYLFTFRLKTADNRYIYVEASCQKGKLNNIDVYFIITRNIQQRIEKFDHDLNVKNEQVRVETNCNQAMLLAHDIRTPLSIFEMGVTNLQQQSSLSTSIGGVLQTLENSTKYMTFIINRIVDTSRVLQGEKPIPTYKDIDIKDVVQKCLAILEEYPKTVPITVCYHFDPSTIIFRCDYDWLWSILINLLTNACDNTIYGYIEVHIRYDDTTTSENKKPQISFEVHDTGVGIDSKDRDKLFYPFATLSNKLNPKHGIGIGLYSCAWRTRFLNGTYKIEPNINGGSVFIIKLPINERSLIPLKTQTNRRKSFLATKEDYSEIKVIIIDDTISFRKLFRRNLEMHGITLIDEAENGETGLEMLKKNNYDIAFVDYYMPLKNGEECVSEYRVFENEEGIYPRLICVLVSADNIASTSPVIVKNIFNDIICKPLDMKLIMNIVQDFFMAQPT